MTNDESLRTRRTLLNRLHDLDDQDSWQIFFNRYWELLYNVARQSGLRDAEAQDVVQETVIAVVKAMPGFRYDPARGSFKQWLLRIARRRIVDQLRRSYRQPPKAELGPEALDDAEAYASAITDPTTGEIDAAWELEWERCVLAEAMARAKRTANPKHFQVFDFCVLKEWPVTKVAATLGVSAAQVYLAKHRISQLVKQTARAVRAEWSVGDGTP
jgi:RNA polymerase sigma-70 factor (ECF subfamily)